MATNPFQPGDAKASETTRTTPSPAAQAAAKFKAQLFGEILNGLRGRSTPSFREYTGGASFGSPIGSDMGAALASVLAAMDQPGAFTGSVERSGTARPPTPSLVSDIGQGIGLALEIANILSGVGGAKGIRGVNPALGDSVVEEYGTNPYGIPGGDASAVPADYPGLEDDSTFLSNLFGLL